MEILHNISLKPYTTFALDVHADFFVDITQEQDIYDLISSDIFATQPHIILGWWANILFTQDYHGLIIKVSLLGKQIVKEDDSCVYLKVGAGENRHETIMRSLQHGYVGWENLVLIPGQVGAAPVGNIWAYGKEAKDIVYEVEGIDLSTQQKHTRTNQECWFGYRTSIFKQSLPHILITAVTFVFPKQTFDYRPTLQYNDIQERIWTLGLDPTTISAKEVAQLIIEIRQNKLPDYTKLGTAWSFFKNPIISQQEFESLILTYPLLKGTLVEATHSRPLIKLSAGQLIELAGFKGQRVGDAGTYEKHALILINYGTASGPEIWAFAQSIQKKVLDMFGVHLEPEVIVV